MFVHTHAHEHTYTYTLTHTRTHAHTHSLTRGATNLRHGIRKIVWVEIVHVGEAIGEGRRLQRREVHLRYLLVSVWSSSRTSNHEPSKQQQQRQQRFPATSPAVLALGFRVSAFAVQRDSHIAPASPQARNEDELCHSKEAGSKVWLIRFPCSRHL